MTNRDRITAVVAISALFLLVMTVIYANNARERAVRAEGRIEVLEERLDTLRASEAILRDSLGTVQEKTRAALDSATTVITVTDTVLQVQMDTLEVLVADPEVLELIEQRDRVHAERLAAKDSVITAQAEEISVLQMLDQSNRQIIANLKAQNEQRDEINAGLEGQIRALKARQWVERGVGVGLVAVAVYGALAG